MLYGSTLSYDLSWLDDYYLLIEAKPFLQNIKNLLALFFSDAFITNPSGLYRPILNITFMADTLLNGNNYLFSHLINILLHAGTVCLLFFTLRVFSVSILSAFVLSLLYAAHPASSIAVAWVPGRNDTLLALWVIPAFLGFEYYHRTGKVKYVFIYSLLLAMAVFTKESAIVLPVLCLLWFFMNKQNSKANLNIICLFSAVPLLIWFVIRYFAALGHTSISFVNTLRNIFYLPVLLGHAVFPFDPVVISPYNLLGNTAVYLTIFIAFALLFAWNLASNIKGKNYNKAAVSVFGIAWFFLFLLPTLAAGNGIGSGSTFFEHRLLVPYIGLLFFFSNLSVPKKFYISHMLAAIMLVMFFFCLSFCQASFYKNRNIFWAKATVDSPESFSNFVRAGMFEEQRRLYGLAEKYYKQALILNPEQPLLHASLSKIAYIKKDLPLAEAEIIEELKINPSYKQGKKWLDLLRRENKIRGVK